jgi:hypothetical protein
VAPDPGADPVAIVLVRGDGLLRAAQLAARTFEAVFVPADGGEADQRVLVRLRGAISGYEDARRVLDAHAAARRVAGGSAS